MKVLSICMDTSIIGGSDEEFAEEGRALLENAKAGEANLVASDL